MKSKNKTIKKLNKKNLFNFKRKKFYLFLFLSTIAIGFLSYLFIVYMGSGCEGMECLALAPLIIGLFLITVFGLIIYNFTMAISYERSKKEKNYLFLIVYLISIVLFIWLVISIPSISSKIRSKQLEKSLELREQIVIDKFNADDFQGCVDSLVENLDYSKSFSENACRIGFSKHELNKAILENDFNICTFDTCFSRYAFINLEPDVCLMAESDYSKIKCLNDVTLFLLDFESCKYLDDIKSDYKDTSNDRNACTLNVIRKINTLNPERIYIIEEEDHETIGYRYQIYYRSRFQEINYDITLCYEIEDMTTREYCIWEFASSIEECSLLTIREPQSSRIPRNLPLRESCIAEIGRRNV